MRQIEEEHDFDSDNRSKGRLVEFILQRLNETYPQNAPRGSAQATGNDDKDQESDDKRKQEAAWRWKEAQETRDKAERELQGPACTLADVYRSSNYSLEKLTRSQATIERRLRNAMQDLERVQVAREAKAAATAKVIDITDLDQNKG